jgi:hypothetical protein
MKVQSDGSVLFSIHQSMISASADAECRRYKMLTGKSGRRWFIACQPNEGDNVYVEDLDPNSQGFAGRTLTFTLESGQQVDLKGPWKTTGGLLKDTGYDVSQKYQSFGLVALNVEWQPGGYIGKYTEIIHRDLEPAIGAFDRIESIAQEYADAHHVQVFFAVITGGGGHSGSRCPRKR